MHSVHKRHTKSTVNMGNTIQPQREEIHSLETKHCPRIVSHAVPFVVAHIKSLTPEVPLRFAGVRTRECDCVPGAHDKDM
jgi:hypothetical protein